MPNYKLCLTFYLIVAIMAMTSAIKVIAGMEVVQNGDDAQKEEFTKTLQTPLEVNQKKDGDSFIAAVYEHLPIPALQVCYDTGTFIYLITNILRC